MKRTDAWDPPKPPKGIPVVVSVAVETNPRQRIHKLPIQLSDMTEEHQRSSIEMKAPLIRAKAWNEDETEGKTVVDVEAEVAETALVNDMSQAVIETSESSMRSITPRSLDSRSHREKIKERVAAAKERALAVHLKPKPKSPPSASHEEDEVEEAMRTHKMSRAHLKAAANAILMKERFASFDFFSKSLSEPEPAPEAASPSKETESEEEKLMSAEVLGSREDDWLPLFSHEAATVENWDLLKEKQRGIFFCPTASPVPIEEKLEPDTIPRFIEEEGLYVGEKAKIPAKRLNKMEQRIMAMGSERLWFGEDGEIKGVQDPLDRQRYKEYMEDIVDPTLFEFTPSVKISLDLEDNLGFSSDSQYTLELDVGSVVFTHHPLFSEEDVLGAKLVALVKTTLLSKESSERLHGQLAAFRGGPDWQSHLAELREIRSKWIKEKSKEREALSAALDTWKKLKELRSRQGYIGTGYKLAIITKDEGSDEWESEYNLYMKEAEEEADVLFKRRMEEYRKKVEDWNQRKNTEGEIETYTTTTEAEDDGGPEKPRRPSKTKISERIVKELSTGLRPPGEPHIEVELTSSEAPEVDNSNEKERRLALNSTQLWISLRHNDKEVDRVKTKRENGPHGLEYAAKYRFCLRLTSRPKSLCLRLIETGLPSIFGKKRIADLYVPVPGRTTTESAEWSELEFTCDYSGGPLFGGVGTEGQLCCGVVSIRTGWGLPMPNIVETLRPIKEQRMAKNLQSLREWAEKVQLDPNDPTNADLLDYLKSCREKELMAKSSSVTQSVGADPLQFCTEEELMANPRLKLLSLRESGQPEFRDMRKIPLNEREIPRDIFKMYDKRRAKERRKTKGYTFDVLRSSGKEFIESIKEEVDKAVQRHQAKGFKEVVHEEPVPDLGTLGLTVMKWLQPKRPLRPKRKERKKMPAKSLHGQQLEVMVNIGRAFEVPVRSDEEPNNNDGYQIVPVRPYIEVTFQDQRRRTTTAEGPNPTWNQDLILPVKCAGGIQTIRDSLYIHLYDETLVDLVQDDRLRDTNVIQRTERHWLGSIRIPFNALYSRVEGTFQLYSPPVLLGYKRESKELRDSTFLTIFVMVHPPLHPPAHLQEKVESEEDAEIELRIDQWLARVTAEFPGRQIPTLVVNSSRKSICVTRFIRPLAPPELVRGEATTPEMLARFVSMIPVYQNSLYAGQAEIWLNSQEILTKCCSERGCRAALLACYLKHYYPRTYLIVGSGLPNGPSLFVLTLTDIGPIIWDPSSATKHSPGDPFSPLSSLHALIDDTNIWVNAQKEELLSQMNLDVKKRIRDWIPAFGRNVSPPSPLAQPEVVAVVHTSESETLLLQDRLEKVLRAAIMKLRPSSRTIWNRYCTASLRKLLPGLERATWASTRSSPPDHIAELDHISKSYKMCGFPINMAYRGATELVESVRSTGVHLNDAPEMEFAVAVYIHPFPFNVLSVWVYVASLVRRR